MHNGGGNKQRVLLCQRPDWKDADRDMILWNPAFLVRSLQSRVSQLLSSTSRRVLEGIMTLRQAGIFLDGTVHMRYRLRGGVKYEAPGSWTCLVCNMVGVGQLDKAASGVGR